MPASDPALDLLSAEERQAFVVSIERVRRHAVVGLSATRDAVARIAFVRHLQDGVDGVVAAARAQGRRIDCQPGCSHCCSARVEATVPEILRIADEIERRGDAARTLAHLERHLAAGGDQGAGWNERAPCPFLEDRLCSIYPVRPAACRKAHSVDVARCEARAATVPQDLELALRAEALIVGTSQAYADSGLDTTRHALIGGVVAALRDGARRERWAAGERVLSGETGL